MKLYQKLSRRIGNAHRCIESGNVTWANKWEADIDAIMEEFPSGSGFNTGTKLDRSESTPERIVLTTAFHHMDEAGGYDGWTAHEVIVTPCMEFGYKLRITGRDRNQIKEYIAECFNDVLTRDVEEYDQESKPAVV